MEFDGGAPGVRLAGTLLLPISATGASPAPGVVLVTGSGAQDRDETIVGRKPMRVLAEALAARGFAVFRYDDRGTKDVGIGSSTGSFAGATLADFAQDAGAAITFLAARDEVDDGRVALCGHSTGGLEGAILAGQGRVPGALVLLAAPTVRGATLLVRQSEDILRTAHAQGRSGLKDDQVDALAAAQTAFIEAYVGDDQAALNSAAERVVRLSVEVRAPGAAVTEEMLALGVKQALAPLQEKWMDHFLRYDPGADLRAATVPVLALFGGRDLQVSPALNVGPAEAALAENAGGSLVVVVPGRNHLFQASTAGLPDEYGRLTDEMGGGVADLIADWLGRVMTHPGAAATPTGK